MACRTLPNHMSLEPFIDHLWHYECLLASPRPLQNMSPRIIRTRHPSEKFRVSRTSTQDSSESACYGFEPSDFRDGLTCASKNSSNVASECSEVSLRTNQMDSVHPYFATEEHRTIFETFDENGDGRLSADEILASMAKLGLEMTKEEFASTISTVDKNGDGFVDSQDFFSLLDLNSDCDLVEKEDEENLKRAFYVFDKNKDGYITAQELHSVLSCIDSSQESRLEDCRNMIRGADLDGDGKVNFLEFQLMMSKKYPSCSAESRSAFQKSPSANSFVSWV